MAGPSVLTGAALLTQWAVFTRRTRLLTENASVSWGAQTLPRLVVARGSVLTVTLQQTVFPIMLSVTVVLAAPPLVALCTDARSSDGVTLGPVSTLTAVCAVRAPEVTLTRAGAVESSPAWLALTRVRRNTAAVSAFVCAQRDTKVSALVEAGAALRASAVHGPHSSPVRRLVTDPVTCALEPVEDVCAARVVNLVKWMGIGLLHCHRVTLPVAAHVRIVRVQSSRRRHEPEEDSQEQASGGPHRHTTTVLSDDVSSNQVHIRG